MLFTVVWSEFRSVFAIDLMNHFAIHSTGVSYNCSKGQI